MKTYKQLIQDLLEAWPGTPEYKKRFGDNDTTGAGSRHNISSSGGVTRATRRYNQDTGESEEATKSREDAKEAPAKRGRGRPPGKYGTYKKKVKESLDIIESLETEEEINQFIDSLDEESYLALEDFLVEEELSPKQKKIAKMTGHPNKIDAEDLAKLRKEETEKCPECGKVHEGECEDDEDEESVDEAMSHQAKTTMKHIKNPTPGEKKAAKDIKPGVSGYADRIAMLKSAQARGALKNEEVEIEEEQLDELDTSTLKSYAKKANKQLKTLNKVVNDNRGKLPNQVKKSIYRQQLKRDVGIDRANSKLSDRAFGITKEEVDIEEGILDQVRDTRSGKNKSNFDGQTGKATGPTSNIAGLRARMQHRKNTEK